MEALLTQNTINISSQLRKCLFTQNKRSGELNPRQVENFKSQVKTIIENLININEISTVEAELQVSLALKGRAAELMINREGYISFSKTDKRKEYLSNLIQLHLEMENELFIKYA